MKKPLLSILAGMTALTANAQLVLDRSDFGYPESSFEMASDTQVTLTAAFHAGGDSMIWDFSNALSLYPTNLFLYRAQDIPEASQFPECNMVLEEEEGSGYYNFINATDSAFYNRGTNDTDPISAEVPKFRYVVLPLSYGMDWLDETKSTQTYSGADFGAPVDSIRVTVDGTFNSECDGTGMLKLPVGQTEALRVKTHVNVDVTVEVMIGSSGWIPQNGQTFEMEFYSFYSRSCGFRIASIEVDQDNTNFGYLDYRSASLLGKPEANVAEPAVYPNPNNAATLYLTPGSAKTVSIMDMNGKAARQNVTLEAGENSIDISDLRPGAYLVFISEGGRIYTQKLIRN